MGALALGVLVSIERIDADGTAFLGENSTYQLSTLMRIGLALLAIAPLFTGLGLAVVPAQVGSPSIAFPRLAALSFWTWLGGAAVTVGAYAANGGPGGAGEPVRLFLVGIGLVAIALALAAVCISATVLTLRAPGMRSDEVPLFSWASFVTSSVMVLAMPILLANVVSLYLSHRYGQIVFGDASRLMRHLEWAVSHPGVALYSLPVLGVIGDIVATSTRQRQPLRSVLIGAIGLAGILYFGADVQRGLNADVVHQPNYFIASLAGILPVLIVLGLCGLCLRNAKPKVGAPIVFALAAGLMAALGGAMAMLMPWRGLGLVDELAVGANTTAGTVFQEGQAVAFIGAGILGLLGALAYWAPRIWGRRIDDKKMLPLALFGLGGTVLVALPLGFLGWKEQPLDAVNFTIDGPASVLNIIVLVGYALLFVAALGGVGLVLQSVRSGEHGATDPWDGQTLEWTDTPLSTVVRSAQPLLDRKDA